MLELSLVLIMEGGGIGVKLTSEVTVELPNEYGTKVVEPLSVPHQQRFDLSQIHVVCVGVTMAENGELVDPEATEKKTSLT